MIDINELIEAGAPEDVIMDAVKKNKAEKAALDAKAKAAKDIESYCAEGRMHLINAILAYDDAFHFFGDEPLDEEDIEDLTEAIKQMEALFPIYAQMIDVQAKMDEAKKSNPRDKNSGYGLFGALGL